MTSEMVDHHFLNPEGWLFKPWLRLEKTLNRLPQAILTSSHHAAQLLHDQFHVDTSLITPIPDCVNECTEEMTPLRVINVPRIVSEKVRVMRTMFQIFSIPFFSWIMIGGETPCPQPGHERGVLHGVPSQQPPTPAQRTPSGREEFRARGRARRRRVYWRTPWPRRSRLPTISAAIANAKGTVIPTEAEIKRGRVHHHGRCWEDRVEPAFPGLKEQPERARHEVHEPDEEREDRHQHHDDRG
jgi:hypothetical protein